MGLPGTARPAVHIAGATPVQRFQASDVPTAPWYAGGTVLGLALCLAAVGYVVGPVAEMVVRLRGRQLARRDQRPDLAADPAQASARWRGPGSDCCVSVLAFITLLVLFSVNQAGAWPAVLAGWLVVRVLARAHARAGGHGRGGGRLRAARGLAAEPLPARRDRRRAGRHRACSWSPAAYYGLFAFPW